MNYQLTARIQRKMPEFSKGQRLIANYIEEHYDEVAFMTAAKLGATRIPLICSLIASLSIAIVFPPIHLSCQGPIQLYGSESGT